MIIRAFFLFIISITAFSVAAQQIEIFGGINSNHFFDNISDNTEYSSNYESGKGYSVGFSFDNPNMNGYASRITLSYNKISGKVSTMNTAGFGGGSQTSAEIEKQSIHLAVYPFTFIVQKIYFSFGLQANFLMSNSTQGFYGNLNSNELIPIEDNQDFHKDLGYGVAMRTHYNIMLNNGLSIIPQYNLYYGIGEEYSTAESEKIKVWQQVLAIGIGMQF